MKHEMDCPCCMAKLSYQLDYQVPVTTCYQEIIESLSQTEPKFADLMNECHPFIFSNKEHGETHEVESYHGEIDVPFPVISIEVMGEAISIPRDSDSVRTWIGAIIVHEYAPKSYDFILYFQRESDGKIEKGTMGISKSSEAYPMVNGIVNYYLRKLSKEKIGVTGKGQKLKYKINGITSR